MAHATIIVDYWEMVTGVQEDSGQTGATAIGPVNPFIDSHDIVRGPSHARTDFDFAWTDSFATFDFQFDHARVGPGFGRAISDGFIFLHSDVDLLLTVEGSYSYQLPRGGMQALTRVVAYRNQFDDPPVYFNSGGNDDTFLHAPQNGTFNLGGQAILPAGQPLVLDYWFELRVDNSLEDPAIGSGGFHLTVQAIPEPATILPLAIGAIAMRRQPARARILSRTYLYGIPFP